MKLLERDDALAALGRALAASHPQGQIATVSGEAGVGKTALLEALADQSPAASFLWGACEALGTPRPLGPLLDLVPELGDEIEPLVATTVPRHQVFAAFATAVAKRRPPIPQQVERRLVRPVHSSKTTKGVAQCHALWSSARFQTGWDYR
jgi:predicted ATPase